MNLTQPAGIAQRPFRFEFEHRLLLSQNAKRALARKDTGPDQSLFHVQLFHFWIMKMYIKGSIFKGHLGGLDKVLKNRDRHHRIPRQILRTSKGLILILSQS